MTTPQKYLVGCYPLGRFQVDVYLSMGESGGCYYDSPEDGRLPRICVGGMYENWGTVISVFLHEALEFCLDQRLKRFVATQELRADSYEDVVFFLHHTDLSAAMYDVGKLVAVALPDLAAMWNEKKPKKEKEET